MSLPSWPPGPTLQNHFASHGHKFPYLTIQEYEDSSVETAKLGVSFTYTDDATGRTRIGFYDKAGNRFTAVTSDGRRIVTHFPPDRGEKYVEELLDSTYSS